LIFNHLGRIRKRKLHHAKGVTRPRRAEFGLDAGVVARCPFMLPRDRGCGAVPRSADPQFEAEARGELSSVSPISLPSTLQLIAQI